MCYYYIGDNMKDDKKHFSLKKLIIFLICFILLSTSIILYSRYIGTSGIFIKEYRISYKSLSDNLYGLKIVHLSDIHYGRTITKKELENIKNEVNLTKPDIIVFSGDLIDKDTKITDKDINILVNFLNGLEANIGKYAITGNHDHKFDNYDIIIENGGFTNLNNKYDLIYGNANDYILIAGVSTNVYGKEKITDKLKETFDYIEQTDKKPNYTILVMHEPDFIDDIDYSKFNLVLAGHSHNGQVRLPFIGAIIKPNYAKKYYDKYYKIKNTDLYISSGIGVSEVNYRLFNRPSFNLYRLTN